MGEPQRIATAGAPGPILRTDDARPPTIGASPATILLMAAWIGLVAGWADLGLMVVNRRLIHGDFYRMGEHFPWLIPMGVTVVVLLPGMVLAVVARWRRGGLRPGSVAGILAFVGSLDVSARLPLAFWASLLLCGGVAIQSARLVDRRRGWSLEGVRRSTPWLVGALLVVMLWKIGGRAWLDHRAMAALPPSPPGARNVLLIVWDTVRAANLSLHGYGRRTTPNLERLASRGVRFDRAFATSSWTLPSHASLFTGRWPHELGVDWTSPMRRDVPTLAESLAALGYDTAGFVANLDYCGRETGLDRGFAHYEDYPIDPYDTFVRYLAMGRQMEVPGWVCVLERLVEKVVGRTLDMVPRSQEHAKPGDSVDRAFLDWLSRRRGRRRPFFAFLNLNDAHSPYEVADPSAPGFGVRPTTCHDRLTLSGWNTLEKAGLSEHDVRMAIDLYDDAIAYLDRQLGALLDELGRLGVLDDTLVIVTADHGEHLGDHLLFFHGCSLYRQVVQVPLVIVGPEGVPSGRVMAEPVSLRDVPATVLDLLGFGRDAPFPGRSLARLRQEAPEALGALTEPLLMETSKPLVLTNQGREPAARGPMKSLIAGGMHYIRAGDGSEELYVLGSDPDERFNLAGVPNAREALRRFRAQLAAMTRKR